MRYSFLVTAVNGLRKKKETKVSSNADEFQEATRRRRTIFKLDSKSTDFNKIPEDLLMNILARLPAKLVTRLMCVSQLWYSLISSRYFAKLFIESPSSTKRPRMLAYLVDKADHRRYKFLTSSSSRDDHSDTSLYVIDQVLNMPGLGGYVVNSLRGLICVKLGRSLRIFNLTTKQRVILPIVRSRLLNVTNDNIWNDFVYDSVHDEYKVLNIVWEGRVVRSEHQVFVLGHEASWRNTKGHIYPHCPYSQGCSMTINSVLYYGAWIDKKTSVVIGFDLASEDFNMIELPIEAGIVWNASRVNLMNYGDKLAVFEYSRPPFDATVHLWVMEDVGKRKWSNKTLVVPISHMIFAHGDELAMMGTGYCGQVGLFKTLLNPNKPRPWVIYDMEKNKIIKSIEISPIPQLWLFGLEKGFHTALWEDDTESIMYLET